MIIHYKLAVDNINIIYVVCHSQWYVIFFLDLFLFHTFVQHMFHGGFGLGVIETFVVFFIEKTVNARTKWFSQIQAIAVVSNNINIPVWRKPLGLLFRFTPFCNRYLSSPANRRS